MRSYVVCGSIQNILTAVDRLFWYPESGPIFVYGNLRTQIFASNLFVHAVRRRSYTNHMRQAVADRGYSGISRHGRRMNVGCLLRVRFLPFFASFNVIFVSHLVFFFFWYVKIKRQH